MHLTIISSASADARPSFRSRCLDCTFESEAWEHEDPAYLAGLRHPCPTASVRADNAG